MVNVSTPNRNFRDISLDFTKNPVTGDIVILEDADAVRQSMKNIILTGFYERQFVPRFGSDTIQQLFENFSPITKQTVEKNISHAIGKWEPRVVIEKVVVDTDEDNHQLSVTIVFTMRNLTQPMTLDVFLKLAR